MRYDAFSKCHPLTNFLFFVGAIAFSVVIQHPAYVAVSGCCALVYFLLLRGRKAIGFAVGMIPVFVLISVINPLFGHYGERTLFTIFGKPYTLEALYYGMVVAGIFVVMMLWFGCYSAVLTSDKFVCLFGSLIPSLSLLLVMVLRMIPNLMRKAMLLSNARKSIGKGVGEGGKVKEKLYDGMNLLSALTDWALEGSIITADSMRSRGYGSAKRTSFQIYRLTALDGILMVLQLLLPAAVLFAGNMEAEFTPAVRIAGITWGLGIYAVYLMIPPLLYLKEAIQWHISISRI